VFAVPVTAAGEFLEGAAFVSDDRLIDGVRFLSMFRIGDVSLETARQLTGISQADLWIAAWALQHVAMVATANVRHFARVPELQLLPY
jgi:predicted nucleic acid-binding protein